MLAALFQVDRFQLFSHHITARRDISLYNVPYSPCGVCVNCTVLVEAINITADRTMATCLLERVNTAE